MRSRNRRSVLFVSHTGVAGGGAEVVLGQMLHVARDCGYETALALPPGNLTEVLGPLSDHVFHTHFRPLRRTRSPLRALWMMSGWIRGSLELIGIARQVGSPIIHANSGVAALLSAPAASLPHRRLLWHQHDIVPTRLVNRMVLMPCGLVSHRVVACSTAVKSAVERLGVPRSRLTVVYNCADDSFFDPLPDMNRSRRSLGLPMDVPLVVLAGRLVPYKGHGLFLEALARLLEDGVAVHGAIAGSRPALAQGDVDPFPGYAETLEKRIMQPDLAGHVSLLGHQSDMRLVLAATDIIVVPSENEPFPLIVLEAMAARKAVIASNSGGHPEAIRSGESGVLFETGSVEALAAALKRVLGDSEYREKLGLAAGERARLFFSTGVFRQHMDGIYREAIGEPES